MRNLNKNYDLIVVGSGAAGCLFSRNLAREDYSVCLVEMKNRSKLSHDWWDLVVTNIFDKVDIKPPESDELFKVGPKRANSSNLYVALFSKLNISPFIFII